MLMKKRKYKVFLSFLLAITMVLTAIMPNAAMIVHAAGSTIKDKTQKASSTQTVMNAADVNTLEMDMSNATVTYSGSLSEKGEAADWSNSETEKGKEKEKLGKAIAGKLDAGKINGTDKSYWVKYSGLKMGDGTYDLKVSIENAHGKISGAEGPYISFFKKNPASMRYSGYEHVTVVYTITDKDEDFLSKDWKGVMTFWDIDSHQALEIRKPNRIDWAYLVDNTELNFNFPNSRLPDDSTKQNIVYCPTGADATDGGTGTTAQKYALYTQVHLTPQDNTMKIRYFSGGKTGQQLNGIFLSFDGTLPEDKLSSVVITPEVTKKVNGQEDITLASPADTFEYTLESTNGNGVGSKLNYFRWEDTLESVLQFSGTPQVTRTLGGQTTDVTSWFNITTNGQTIKAEVQQSHLTDEDMNGTFTLHFHAKVKDGVSLSSYYDSRKEFAVIPNKGFFSILKKGWGKKTAPSNVVNVRIPLAELNIDKVADKYEYKVGDTVTYTINVKNTTPNATACHVAVTDTIPSDLKITGVSTSGVAATSSFSGQDVKINAGSLAQNQTLTATVTCTALESGNTKELYNTAQATCWNIKNVSGYANDDAETFINSAKVSVDKASDRYEYEIGDQASFTVRVRNKKGIANHVVVTDQLPDGMTLDYDSVQISGLPKTVNYNIAGTADPTNELNNDLRDQTELRNVITEKQKSGDNGWVYTINHMPANSEAVITFKAVANEVGNGKEQQNIVTVTAANAETVQDDAEYYINTADLSLTKKYVNPYKAEKNDNRADNEFRVHEEVTGNELVQYVVHVKSSGVDGTVAKNVTVNDTTLPDGLALNYKDITIVETDKEGQTKEFTYAGGDGRSFKYHIAGTEDVTNQIDEDKYKETEDRTPVITLEKSGNGYILKDTYLAAGHKLTVNYTAKATEDVNGMEIVNTAKATADNIVKENGKAKTVKDAATVYINSPRLAITKKADSDNYAVGDTVTYTINVRNSKTGTVARNLVFTDDILTEGVKLQKASLCFKHEEISS